MSISPDGCVALKAPRGVSTYLFHLFIFSPPPLFLLLEDYSSYLLCLHISANPIESTRALSAGYELSLRDLEKKKGGGGGGDINLLLRDFRLPGENSFEHLL